MAISDYDGIRFYITVNEQEQREDGSWGSQTMHVVHGTWCARTNKKRLKEYLTAMGEPENQHKRILKAMGFWGNGLGAR